MKNYGGNRIAAAAQHLFTPGRLVCFRAPVSSSADAPPACQPTGQNHSSGVAANSSIHREFISDLRWSRTAASTPAGKTQSPASPRLQHTRAARQKRFSSVSVLVFMEHFLPTCHQTLVGGPPRLPSICSKFHFPTHTLYPCK